MAAPVGVLVMAYGGPNSLEEVQPYLMDVRGYRPTPAHVVEAVRQRYAAIGGRSPIREGTQAQTDALQRALDAGGPGFRAAIGMRHWHPYIKETLGAFAAQGIDRAVGVVMAPHYSKSSIEHYFEAAAASGAPVTLAPIREWHLLPGYLDAMVDRVREGLARFPAGERDHVAVIFSAHSLPQRILEWGDPYPVQLAATTAALAQRLGLRVHRFAYQSAAMTPEPWLGPDAGDVIRELAAQHKNILLAPIGFTTEHVEILYDVDIEFRRLAEGLGVRLERIPMVGNHSAMMTGLAGLVRDAAKAQGWV